MSYETQELDLYNHILLTNFLSSTHHHGLFAIGYLPRRIDYASISYPSFILDINSRSGWMYVLIAQPRRLARDSCLLWKWILMGTILIVIVPYLHAYPIICYDEPWALKPYHFIANRYRTGSLSENLSQMAYVCAVYRTREQWSR